MSNLETVQRIYQAFGRGDVPAMLGELAETIEWEHDAASFGEYGVPWLHPGRGRKHVAGFLEALTALEFHAFTPVSLLAGDNQVVAIISLEATVKATGKRFTEYEAHLWTFGADGLVSRFRHFVDTAKHIRAAGLSV